eukprot:3279073-Pyramimonas_sp.AAC.1
MFEKDTERPTSAHSERACQRYKKITVTWVKGPNTSSKVEVLAVLASSYRRLAQRSATYTEGRIPANYSLNDTVAPIPSKFEKLSSRADAQTLSNRDTRPVEPVQPAAS